MGIIEKSYEQEAKIVKNEMTSYKLKDIETWLINIFTELHTKEIDTINVKIETKYYEMDKNKFYWG